MSTVGIIGAGKLGLCLGLILDEAGHKVVCYDKNSSQRTNIREKNLRTIEPYVEEMLTTSKQIEVVEAIEDVYKLPVNFVVVLTPSLDDGSYDHSALDSIVTSLIEENEKNPDFTEKLLIIVCTTMPQYCKTVQDRLSKYNYKVLYSPEFIAQGSIVQGMKCPDLVLIGGEDNLAKEKLKQIYASYVKNTPQYSLMSLTEAEICKISLNCFLTTKISFANTIGDIVEKAGGDPNVVLGAIGADSRVGKKFLRWGHGYGGPCLPRDNRALCHFSNTLQIQNKIGESTDELNREHLKRLVDFVKRKNTNNNPVFFDGVVYKKNTTILEESQQFELAKACANDGMRIVLHDSDGVLNTLKSEYGTLFEYKYTYSEDESKDWFIISKYIS